ncbi:endonuclease/exonuclease/phosphatase family protein [Pseudonocardia sp. CA-142604]|uniref:endonuclease/exonuclease/phosphatase family protein n=1 Tax=Pseudonocardia sp. CA-142604 TaxID=3240024 RepID=UPI003D902CE7
MTSLRRNTCRAVAAITVAGVAGLTVLVAPASAAPSPGPVIAEVYGGGGNSGTTLTRDFIELATAGTTPTSVADMSVQYLPGSPSGSSRWQATPLSGSVNPGARLLVAEAAGGGGTVELPTPDVTGSINMSATTGTVALVNGTTPLTCLTAADCAADSRVVDLVGYGSAVVRETNPAPAPSATTSVFRTTSVDTDDNAADFVAGPPTPQNAAGGEAGGPSEATDARIRDVQGTTRTSPLVGKSVRVPGVVTATRGFGSSRGFWIQDPQPDDDPRTSEGLLVFTGSVTPTVAVGDAVTVTGTVAEYRPESGYQTTTELTGPTWTTESGGHELPGPVMITQNTVPGEYVPQPGGNIESLPLEPSKYALDFWEAHEGELVSVADVRAVSGTTAFDEVFVTTKPDEHPSARGGSVYLGYDQTNTGIVKVQSLIPFAQRPFPQANTGDVLTGITSGPVEYSQFGGYTIQASILGELKNNGLAREVTRKRNGGELAVATYNVENLSAADDQAKFDGLARGITDHLGSPDIVTLEEIQDDNGPTGTNDGVVAADQTLKRFVDAIVAAGGPRYEWRQINPQDMTDGGEPGGNIRVGFLFDPKRVSFVDRPGGDATTAVDVVMDEKGKNPHLSISPGRVDPTNPAWQTSRKPLAGEFVFHGKTVFIIANHFASKGGDQPTHGINQPPDRSSEVQRTQQATVLRGFIDKLLAADPNAGLVVAGDLNDYQFSPTLQILTQGGALTALMNTLPENERYSYVFDGNSQVLDHILVSKALKKVDYDVVHINSEFAQQSSDHDPQIVQLQP